MLTPRQNLIEVMTGGNPDRYVNMFEAFTPMIPCNPLYAEACLDFADDGSFRGFKLNEDGLLHDEWNVYFKPMENQPGYFPVHDAKHTVCNDICDWRNQVVPPRDISEDKEAWKDAIAMAATVDRNEKFLTASVRPGVFERLHFLHDVEDTMCDLYDEPEAMQELIDCIVEYEMQTAKAVCEFIKPEALFHHDDWGTQISTFLSPSMFEEFIVPAYKKIYGYYKDHGVQLIIHHTDSFGETLVPYMIEVGIDIWQGVLSASNDIPKLIETYGGQITFMGSIENARIDKPDWTEEEVKAEVNRALDFVHSKYYYIPGMTAGDAESGYPGVYEAVAKYIDERSKIDFA